MESLVVELVFRDINELFRDFVFIFVGISEKGSMGIIIVKGYF